MLAGFLGGLAVFLVIAVSVLVLARYFDLSNHNVLELELRELADTAAPSSPTIRAFISC